MIGSAPLAQAAPGQRLPLQAIFASNLGISVDRGTPLSAPFNHPSFPTTYPVTVRGPLRMSGARFLRLPLISHSIPVVFLLSVRFHYVSGWRLPWVSVGRRGLRFYEVAQISCFVWHHTKKRPLNSRHSRFLSGLSRLLSGGVCS